MVARPLEAKFLLLRGYCCDNSCVNCPYKVNCLSCSSLNKVARELDGFTCKNCGEMHSYEPFRVVENSIEFEDGS